MSRVEPLPAPDPLARLSPDAIAFARAALSPQTRRAYGAQWGQWCHFCSVSGIDSLPAAPESVANWLAGRAASGPPRGDRARDGRTGQSVATLRLAIAAIRLAHLAAGFSFDSRHPALMMVMRGIARTQGARQRQAAPLTATVVKDLLSATVGQTASRQAARVSARDCRDAALLAIGYCFGRRRADLVGLDWQQLGSGDGVLILGPERLELHLVRSKASNGAEPEVFAVPTAANRLAVRVIEAWLSVGEIAPGTPVLRRIRRGDRVTDSRLDAQSVSLIIRENLRMLYEHRGMAPDDAATVAARFSAHSLRVGLAVTAAEAGADSGAIQRALGHRSPQMAARYARAATLARASPHGLPGVGLDARPRVSQSPRRAGP